MDAEQDMGRRRREGGNMDRQRNWEEGSVDSPRRMEEGSVDAEEEDIPPGAEFFVTCHPGLEDVVSQELADLGIAHVRKGKAGVCFWSERKADGYRACLWLRSAIRVLLLLSRHQLETDVSQGYRSGDSVGQLSQAI